MIYSTLTFQGTGFSLGQDGDTEENDNVGQVSSAREGDELFLDLDSDSDGKRSSIFDCIVSSSAARV